MPYHSMPCGRPALNWDYGYSMGWRRLTTPLDTPCGTTLLPSPTPRFQPQILTLDQNVAEMGFDLDAVLGPHLSHPSSMFCGQPSLDRRPAGWPVQGCTLTLSF
jgi:hypothetical protein